jgi:phage host-nuclease inhibitor protein Gam
MSKTRETKKIITETISRESAESIFGDYADADAKLQKIQAEMDIKMTEIREKYSDKIAGLTDVKEKCLEKLQHFATSTPEYFTNKKSLELSHGKIGFRTSTPSLKALKGFTWPSITNLLEEFLPDFVRTKSEPDKEALLAARDQKEVSDLFTKCGIKVEQAETFFVELKKEEAVAA